jgi:tetratricopeptide (TPR) repeat protein
MPDPLQRRLDQLHNQWVTFADDPHARLLVWTTSEDERGMVEAFVARECDARRAATPDLFLQLCTAWTGQSGHGARLCEELNEQAAEADVEWCHAAREGADLDALLGALTSLRRRLGERMLAVWLESSDIDVDGYLLWLQRLVHAAPEGIRFLVVGEGYRVLAQAEPQRVHEVECDLDMPGAFEEVADRKGGHTPDDLFLRLQMRLNAQVAACDLEGARRTTERAVALAEEQGCAELGAAVQLILGGAYAGAANYVEAVAAYREAGRHAAGAKEATTAQRMQLVAGMGCGSVLFGAGAYGPASDCFLRAAALAGDLGDGPSELDGYRLAAACAAELGEREQAWRHGVQGVRAAAKLEPAQREHSTLHALAEQLERLFPGDRRLVALREQLAKLERT